MQVATYFEHNEHLAEPLFNDIFLRVFGQVESCKITKSLVNSILRAANLDEIDHIERISCEESVITGEVDSKGARFDILLTTEGRLVDLEAQHYPEDIEKRSLFYASKAISASMKRGMTYKDVPRVVVITLLDARPHFPDSEDFLHTCRMGWECDNAFEKGFDGVTFILVELEKVRKRYTCLQDDILENEHLSWLYLLSSGFRRQGEVEAIMDAFPTIEEFAERYGIALSDPQLRMKYDLYEESERELASRADYFERLRREGHAEGFEEGHAEGFEEGRAEGREKGLAEGLAEGRAEGFAEGRIAQLSESVRSLSQSLKIDFKMALNILGASQEDSKSVLSLLENENRR